jgi:hypothetical protein
MRLLLEIILAAALIALAGDKSLKERVSEAQWIGDKIAPVVKTPAQPQQAQHPRLQTRSIITPAPTVSGAWMWDPNRKTPLDPPSKKHAESTPH